MRSRERRGYLTGCRMHVGGISQLVPVGGCRPEVPSRLCMARSRLPGYDLIKRGVCPRSALMFRACIHDDAPQDLRRPHTGIQLRQALEGGDHVRKVLFVNRFDNPSGHGGIEVTLDHLTRGLMRHGVLPVILSLEGEENSGLRSSERDGLRVWRATHPLSHRMKSTGHIDIWKRAHWHINDVLNHRVQAVLRRVLDAEKPDIVSLHNLSGWSAATWKTLSEAGLPSVQVLHDYYAICPKTTMFRRGRNCSVQCVDCRILRAPHRRMSNLVSAVVGNSRFTLQRHLDLGYFADVSTQQVIYNARDPKALGITGVSARTDKDGPFRLGYIGRLAPSKGVSRLLDAFSRLRGVDAELWIAGSGTSDYVSSLRDRFASSRIRFLGRVSPRDFFPNVDVVVVPSLWHEPLGMVAAEAMAFGKPIIASRRGGIQEIVGDGEGGILYDPDDADALARALRDLIADKDRVLRLSGGAPQAAQRFMGMDAWVERYIDLYSKVAEDGSPSRRLDSTGIGL
jgi:glycosyltransferase involved in cell wall biosynthesis